MTTNDSPRILGGIDLGATKILSLIVDAAGSRLAEDVRPTLGDEGPDAVIARMADSLRESLTKANLREGQLTAVGISAPGPVDCIRGIVTRPPNLPGWRDVPLASRLQQALAIPCFLENDANAAAVAEHRFGAGRGVRDMLFITVSSGVGGGIIIDGDLYRGVSGGAGEVGHIVLNEDGPPCGCGRRGCLEVYTSGLAIAREGSEIAAREPDSRLARIAAESPPLTAEAIHRAADEGDEAARDIIARAGRRLGEGIASLINVLNPELIVLGGSLIKMGDIYLGPAREAAASEAFPQHWRDVRIVEVALGDESPALGAASLAADAVKTR
jgi:glucokinase